MVLPACLLSDHFILEDSLRSVSYSGFRFKCQNELVSRTFITPLPRLNYYASIRHSANIRQTNLVASAVKRTRSDTRKLVPSPPPPVLRLVRALPCCSVPFPRSGRHRTRCQTGTLRKRTTRTTQRRIACRQQGVICYREPRAAGEK